MRATRCDIENMDADICFNNFNNNQYNNNKFFFHNNVIHVDHHTLFTLTFTKFTCSYKNRSDD